MKLRTVLSALAVTAGLSAVSFAQITGTVKLEGEAPEPAVIDMSAVRDCAQAHADPVFEEDIWVGEDNGLKNVVISIVAPEGMPLPGDVPEEAAELDQKGCMYAPRVVPMMVGQRFMVKNSDPFMHNVNAQPRINRPFNFAQPNVDPGREVPSPRAPETYRVRCDVHPWMTAYVRALEHPYFARTSEDGEFSFNAEQLPDGEYTVVAWHEKFGEQEQQVTIQNGQGEVNFTFQAGQAAASPIQVTEITLEMGFNGEGTDVKADQPMSCGGACCGPKE